MMEVWKKFRCRFLDSRHVSAIILITFVIIAVGAVVWYELPAWVSFCVVLAAGVLGVGASRTLDALIPGEFD
jgi:uncharacterized membrane protein YesL